MNCSLHAPLALSKGQCEIDTEGYHEEHEAEGDALGKLTLACFQGDCCRYVARDTGDGVIISRGLSWLAFVYLLAGDFAMARQLADEELMIAHSVCRVLGIA